MKALKSNALRNSARGQQCTFQIVGVCNNNPETVVLCHLPDESHGMSRKSDDVAAAYGCSACHDVVDGRVHCEEYQQHKWFYNYRAVIRTLRAGWQSGLIKVKGAK